MSSNVADKKDQKAVSDENIETPKVSLNGDEKTTNEESPENKDELEELRRLIIQPEEVGEVLPTAVIKRSEKDNKLTEATLPLVEENIRQSALRDPKILAEALFPVIGPAIRKAIAEALSSMVQNLNQTLEHRLSPKSIGWRIEAWQTGKSFGEVVMLKTLLYRVEQVFLIHRETGLLLQHVAANPGEMEDADMVSAMLTAITDFVHDSFKTSDDATLDSLKINELSVWIESSPDAIIAAVIRGNPPLTLRQTFDETIEQIQFTQEFDLDNFKGDAKVFDISRPFLENCLRFQSSADSEKENKFLKPSTLLVSALAILILIGGFFYVRDYLRWTGFVDQLRAESGIVVTQAERGWFVHTIGGLRDPLAANPEEILKNHNFDGDDVEQNWQPFQDGSAEFILKRAEKYLRPPEGVSLKLEDRTLVAEGKIVSQEWFTKAGQFVPILFGVDDFKIADGGFSELVSKVEAENFLFECGSTNLSVGQTEKLDNLAETIGKIIDLEKNTRLEIQGFGNNTGTAEANLEISKQRAEIITNELENRSLKIKNLHQTNSKFINVVAVGKNSQSDECKVTLKISPLKK